MDSESANSITGEPSAVVRVSVPGRAAAGHAAEVVEDVPQELQLLKGINAFATPGNLLALMGGSGGLLVVGGVKAVVRG